MKGQPTQTEYPEDFVIWAREKMRQDKEFILHRAQFGPPLVKNIAQMILAATGEGECGKL